MSQATHSFAVFSWGVLIYNVLVILWGALVRATGSGAGCGGHWPLCNGDVLPAVSETATVIEFTHRVMSGIALILVVAMFVWAWNAFPKAHAVRRWAAWSVVFILTEALLGASLVLLGHVAKDESIGRVYSLAAHLVNTFLLLAALALTAWRARDAPIQKNSRAAVASRSSLILSICALVMVAVAGAITALGDTLFPPQTLAQGLADDFSAASSFLIRLRVIHPALAIAAGGWIAAIAVRSLRAGAHKTLAKLLLALVAGEVAVGGLTVALRAPAAIQLLHLLIADSLWISLVLFSSEKLRQNRNV